MGQCIVSCQIKGLWEWETKIFEDTMAKISENKVSVNLKNDENFFYQYTLYSKCLEVRNKEKNLKKKNKNMLYMRQMIIKM